MAQPRSTPFMLRAIPPQAPDEVLIDALSKLDLAGELIDRALANSGACSADEVAGLERVRAEIGHASALVRECLGWQGEL